MKIIKRKVPPVYKNGFCIFFYRQITVSITFWFLQQRFGIMQQRIGKIKKRICNNELIGIFNKEF